MIGAGICIQTCLTPDSAFWVTDVLLSEKAHNWLGILGLRKEKRRYEKKKEKKKSLSIIYKACLERND